MYCILASLVFGATIAPIQCSTESYATLKRCNGYLAKHARTVEPARDGISFRCVRIAPPQSK